MGGQKPQELSYGLLVPSQSEQYGAVGGHSLQAGGRSWGSKLHHDSIARKCNIMNIGNGKQIYRDCSGFAQGCSNLVDIV